MARACARTSSGPPVIAIIAPKIALRLTSKTRTFWNSAVVSEADGAIHVRTDPGAFQCNAVGQTV